MKKRIALLGIFLIFLCMLGFLISESKRKTQFVVDNGGNFYVSVKADESTQKIMPWYDETQGVYYFFLPSCVNDETIYFDSFWHSIEIDGNKIHKRAKWVWEKDRIYSLGIDGDFMRITFMKSANLSSLFINTDNISMHNIQEDKNYQDSGSIEVISEDDQVQYKGKVTRISARGNTTFGGSVAKKSYTVILKDKYPLCNLAIGKNWKLLGLYYEYDKIHSKIIFDIARQIGLSSTPECTWVDLYCNGEYQGLYLLAGDVSNSYKDTNGVLIEKEQEFRLKEDEPYFRTSDYIFTYDEPEDLTKEKMDESEIFINTLEKMLNENNILYEEYMDIDSLAKQYLLNKIFMEKDAMWASTFYYIDLEKNKLYAGPLWDYDRACGLILPDYTLSMDEEPNNMNKWYDTLYQNPDFFEVIYHTYLELLPEFENILYQDIDKYVDWIQASEAMDAVLYDQDIPFPLIYAEWDSCIKYLKYFLAHRLNYLNDLWGIEGHSFQSPESTGEYHTIYFKKLDGTTIEKIKVMDGSCLTEFPVLDEKEYIRWYMKILCGNCPADFSVVDEKQSIEWYYWDKNTKKIVGYEYSTMRPVYEDVYCCARIVEQE